MEPTALIERSHVLGWFAMAYPTKQREKSTGKEASRSGCPCTPSSLRSSALEKATQKKMVPVSPFPLAIK
jgi:hypothetical protein